MFLPSLTLLATLSSLFLPHVHAVGRAIVSNECPEAIYLWSVGGSIGPQQKIQPSTSYSETFRRDPQSGGIALKISPIENGIFQPNVSQTIFAYNLDGQKIWYDMSDIFGDGFAGRTMSLKPSDTTCQSIVWGYGKQPAGSSVKVCQSGSDLTLSFCTGGCLPSWYPCGNAAPGSNKVCCTHCIGSHHCVAPPA
ncbi:hypothetical protein COCMIDRAFT_105724 [Bipolaris oryzae ATCC 44560]|uniref:BYS1 domain protein n=1 Tax=Bipolaris oryzae ATCC 44560 TaxID=930090 RepID=W6Z1S2_COCMI|nr:uncharacterized protein COCMIDRAFT_105724 [Bipolaris oryzae ATCC 44560]EUC41604.1 hypothetical protein COCMIDRAFT_105724 [Bipolaris oryzae ATCC 44560]